MLSGGQEELGHGGIGWSWWELWPEAQNWAHSEQTLNRNEPGYATEEAYRARGGLFVWLFL